MRARHLLPLALVAVLAATRALACDNDTAAERAMRDAQRVAERAQRIAEQVASQAQHDAEMAARRARWAADHASEQAQADAERVQAQAERAAEAAQRNAEHAARAAERAAERAAIGARGVVVTNDAILFLDGPEVPRDDVMWADDARSRRIRQAVTTDTTLSVSPGVTLLLANVSGDIAVKVWDRSEVRVNAEHDKSDRVMVAIKDGQLKLFVRSDNGEPADVEWNLTVPAWLPLEISGLESEIAVTGMRAPVRAQSMRGDVHVSACQGPMELHSLEGEVHVEDASGGVSAGSINSVVRLVRVLGPIEAQSVNGDISMDDVSSADVSASTLNGRVYYASKFQSRGRYALSSHNGRVYVGVDQAQPLNVTVSSYNGQVESSLPVPPTPPAPPTSPGQPSAPSAMGWRSWKWSWPAEPAPSPSSSGSGRGAGEVHPRVRSARMMVYTPRPGDAPRAPELALESFGGMIQLASRAEIERALQLRQAIRDSVENARTLARLRRLGRMPEHELGAPEARKTEDPDKN